MFDNTIFALQEVALESDDRESYGKLSHFEIHCKTSNLMNLNYIHYVCVCVCLCVVCVCVV